MSDEQHSNVVAYCSIFLLCALMLFTAKSWEFHRRLDKANDDLDALRVKVERMK
jgi:hypothetical protein